MGAYPSAAGGAVAAKLARDSRPDAFVKKLAAQGGSRVPKPDMMANPELNDILQLGGAGLSRES